MNKQSSNIDDSIKQAASDVGTAYRIGGAIKKGLGFIKKYGKPLLEGAAAIASGGAAAAGLIVRKAAGLLFGALWKSALTGSFRFGIDYNIPDKRPFYKKHKTTLIILAIVFLPFIFIFIITLGISGALVTSLPGS